MGTVVNFSNRISQRLHEEHRATIALVERIENLLARQRQSGAPDVNDRGTAQLLADLSAGLEIEVLRHFAFEEDKIFAYLNLNDAELKVYDQYYALFADQVPIPDLVIYLQATREALRKRIEKKNVPFEPRISDDYLQAVVNAYEHFFFHYKSSDLLVIETSEIDFVDRNEDLQELLKRLSQPVKGTQYFLPLGSASAD